MKQINIYHTLPENFTSQMSIATCWIKCKNKVLFLQRNENSKLWATPGGEIKINETPIDGMIREIWEETSIYLKIEQIMELGHCYIKTPDWQYINYMFFVELQNKPIIKTSIEHRDFKWITLLESKKLPLLDSVLETIEIFNTKLRELQSFTG
ncbi:MAG: NUDIX hydrolase [Legionellales bacterium]|nr:NUDIX hydrolase [Legionellales bacterium]